jgi:hypothetical protein
MFATAEVAAEPGIFQCCPAKSGEDSGRKSYRIFLETYRITFREWDQMGGKKSGEECRKKSISS